MAASEISVRSAGALTITDEEVRFCEYVELGLKPAQAAFKAGLSEMPNGGDGIATRLVRRPHIQAYMRERSWADMSVRALPASVNTLVDVMEDKTCPASARVSAAKAVLSAVGLLRPQPKGLQPHQNGDVPAPNGADVPAIGETLRQSQQLLEVVRAQLMRSEPLDVTPEAAPIDL